MGVCYAFHAILFDNGFLWNGKGKKSKSGW